MKYSKRISSYDDYIKLFESFDDIDQDIEGLLIDLKDKGLIDYSIIKDNTSGGLEYKIITFTRTRGWLFKTMDLFFEVKTLEDYLVAHNYKFHYEYNIYDENDEFDDGIFNSFKSIDDIKNLRGIGYIHLNIINKY